MIKPPHLDTFTKSEVVIKGGSLLSKVMGRQNKYEKLIFHDVLNRIIEIIFQKYLKMAP